MAKAKAKGASRLGRDSKSKRLGVKVFGGSLVSPGNVIVRQRGTKFHPGEGVKKGSDDTLFAIKEGKVLFKKRKIFKFPTKREKRVIVEILPK